MLRFKDAVEMIARLSVSAWYAIACFLPFALWTVVEVAFAAAPFLALYKHLTAESPTTLSYFFVALMFTFLRYGFYRIGVNERDQRLVGGGNPYGRPADDDILLALYGSPAGSGRLSLACARGWLLALKYIGSTIALATFAVLALWFRGIQAACEKCGNTLRGVLVFIGIAGFLVGSAVIGGEVWMLTPQMTKDGDDYPLWLAWLTAPIYITLIAAWGGSIWYAEPQGQAVQA